MKRKIKKLLLLQKDGGILIFNNLPFHGHDVSLEKHRPNGEKYPVGRPQEQTIKIDVIFFG